MDLLEEMMPESWMAKEYTAGRSKRPSAFVICLVHLVSFVQPNKQNKPNEQDRLADIFASC
jgi:hypothetical protein